MTGVYPLLGMARAGGSEIGLGPYAQAVFAAIGVFFSTIVFNLYFINLPIEGAPVELGDYLKGSFLHHVLGFLGGAMWLAGSLTHWITSSVPSEIGIGAARGSAFVHGAFVLAMLWGLLVWREFRGAGGAANLYMAVGLLLTIAAAAMVSFAPGL
jgi:glucose uptake protein